MKIAGIMLLSAAVIIFGFLQSEKIMNKSKILQDFRLFLNDAACKIEFSSMTVSEILRGNDRRRLMFLNGIDNQMIKAGTGNYIADNCPDRETAELIGGFIAGLGKSSKTGQLEHCRLYETMTDEKIAERSSECERKASLCRSLSCLSAAAVFIILI